MKHISTIPLKKILVVASAIRIIFYSDDGFPRATSAILPFLKSTSPYATFHIKLRKNENFS